MNMGLYIALILGGIILIGAEIYVPGGILGLLGALALIGAAALGFMLFGPANGLISALIIVAATTLGFFLWIRYFPGSSMGKLLTLGQTGDTYRSSDDRTELLDAEGTALTNLTPSGVAEINGQRIDVVADGGWVDQGARVKVVNIHGNRVVVDTFADGE